MAALTTFGDPLSFEQPGGLFKAYAHFFCDASFLSGLSNGRFFPAAVLLFLLGFAGCKPANREAGSALEKPGQGRTDPVSRQAAHEGRSVGAMALGVPATADQELDALVAGLASESRVDEILDLYEAASTENAQVVVLAGIEEWLGAEPAVAILPDAIASEDQDLTRALFEAIGERATDNALFQLADFYADSSSNSARTMIWESMRTIESADAIGALSEIAGRVEVEDPYGESLGWAAAESILKLGNPAATTEFIALLDLQENPKTRELLAGALFVHAQNQSVAALAGAAGGDKSATKSETRHVAVAALGMHETQEAAYSLRKLANDSDPTIRGAAAAALENHPSVAP
jgi:HEAT repeat protein